MASSRQGYNIRDLGKKSMGAINKSRCRLIVVSLASLVLCLAVWPRPALAIAGDDKTRTRAERALRDGEYETAAKLFHQLLAKDSRDIAARLGLSFTLLKQRNLQDAFDHAARVIAIDPLSARAHALLGAAVLASGDFRMSVEEFRTALSIKDDEALAIAGLAMVDFYENRVNACLSGLRRATAIDPNEPDYVFSLGQAAARSERFKEAADAYERFLSIAPRTDLDRRARIRGLIDFLRYLGKQGSLYVTGGANRTLVKFESTDHRPIIAVRINGSKELLHFVLDTGSGMSVISDETARRLGLHAVARGGEARAVGGGGRFEIVYGYLSSIEIGGARVENVPVYIRKFYDEKNRVDGFIGLSVISKFFAAVDYGSQTLALVRQRGSEGLESGTLNFKQDGKPESESRDSNVIEIPIRTTSSGFLSGEVQIDGIDKPQNFIIDTGASVSVISEKLAALDEVQSFVQPGRMRVFGAAGISENVKTVTLPRIALGAHGRDRIDAAVLDLDAINETAGFNQNGILGGNFLHHFRIAFDFQKGLIRLAPLPKATVEKDSTPTVPEVEAP
ncbi:MAG: aspartyl protease family protein [Pyrinomonadaceae bacterium]